MVDTAPPAVTVYWRPGCPYCALLRRGLRRAGIASREVDIWQDPAAAATVRGIAGGNETVPTVVVGTTALVNPSVGAVRAALAEAAPEQLPAPRASLARRLTGRRRQGTDTAFEGR